MESARAETLSLFGFLVNSGEKVFGSGPKESFVGEDGGKRRLAPEPLVARDFASAPAAQKIGHLILGESDGFAVGPGDSWGVCEGPWG